MNDSLVSVLLLAVGASLGLVSSLYLNARQQRQVLTLKVLEQYFEVRKDVVTAVTPLANIGLTTSLSPDERKRYSNKVSNLFYTHYDFLPRSVLEALITLQACLDSPSGRLFAVRDNCIAPMNQQDVMSFVDSCAIFQNTSYVAPLALSSANPVVRANQALRLHARHVLQSLNRYASVEDLLRLPRGLSKGATSE
jgi:hypothetical protein